VSNPGVITFHHVVLENSTSASYVFERVTPEEAFDVARDDRGRRARDARVLDDARREHVRRVQLEVGVDDSIFCDALAR
jgi:hypothetical protein